MSDTKTVLLLHLLFSLLQCAPEFSAANSILMTTVALVSLTAMVEYMAITFIRQISSLVLLRMNFIRRSNKH
jgi:hypothetical protein